MALPNDRIERETGEATEIGSIGQTLQAARIEQWLNSIHIQGQRVVELRQAMRNYRIAVDGPIPESACDSTSPEAPRDERDSKLIQMTVALDNLSDIISSAEKEYGEFQDLNIVNLNETAY